MDNENNILNKEDEKPQDLMTKKKPKKSILKTILIVIGIFFLIYISFGAIWVTYERETGFYKPAVYLYPQQETQVSIEILPSQGIELKTTYPKYADKWDVKATSEGLLTDESGRQYDYLFYDAISKKLPAIENGYCVHKDELIPFFEDILAKYGLNEKEANEFIVYWLPLLEENEYNLISFVNEWYEDAVELKINPAPDNTLRLFMLYKPLGKAIEIEPQEIPEFNRTGFVVVEWGGAKM